MRSPLRWIDAILTNDKISEWIKDYKGQISYGRVGGNICLLCAVGFGALGGVIAAWDIFYSVIHAKPIDVLSLDKTLSYCSLLSLQFLGTAVGLYIPSKASETLSKKWAPGISETTVKVASVANAIAASQQENDTDKV